MVALFSFQHMCKYHIPFQKHLLTSYLPLAYLLYTPQPEPFPDTNNKKFLTSILSITQYRLGLIQPTSLQSLHI